MQIKPLWQTGTDNCMVNVMVLIVVSLDVETLVMEIRVMAMVGNVVDVDRR